MRSGVQRTELGEILTAIREVEASLDRRAERVGGAIMVMWGVIVALIAGFYQLAAWNESYQDALGPLFQWAWVGPVAVGYAAGALINVRMLGRAGDAPARRQAFFDLVPAVASSAIAVALVVTERHDLIPGALLVGFSVSLFLRCRGATRAPARFLRAGRWASAVCALVGVALLAWPIGGAWWIMGVVFGGSLLLLGTLRMSG